MFTIKRLLVLCVLIAVGTAGAVSAAAATNPAKFKTRTRIAKLQVDVAGYVETRQLHDTTSDCFPGERWVQTNRFDVETGNFVNLSIKNISAPGIPSVTTSSFSKAVGSAKTRGTISDYKATNYCTGEQQKLNGPPACASNSGKIAIALTPGDLPDDEGDLTPLRGKPLLLTIKRAGGGKDTGDCLGTGAGSVTGKDATFAVVGTSALPGIADILPANLDAIKVFAIRRTQRIRRAIVIDGPCSTVRVTAGPPPGATPNPGALNADGDCRLIGKVVLTIRSRR